MIAYHSVTGGSGRGRTIVIAALLLISISCSLPTAFASEKWPGVDKEVVEKYAKAHGREAREPLINTDQGDLLLFVFLIAGVLGGFATGYYWRSLMESSPRAGNSDAGPAVRQAIDL